jgi:hypothetical protein
MLSLASSIRFPLWRRFFRSRTFPAGGGPKRIGLGNKQLRPTRVLPGCLRVAEPNPGDEPQPGMLRAPGWRNGKPKSDRSARQRGSAQQERARPMPLPRTRVRRIATSLPWRSTADRTTREFGRVHFPGGRISLFEQLVVLPRSPTPRPPVDRAEAGFSHAKPAQRFES